MQYLAVDIGSTNVQCALLQPGERVCRELWRGAFPAPRGGLAPGLYEVDAQALFALVRERVEAALREYPGVLGILFSTQMHGFVLTDGENRPVSGYVSWRDGAAAGIWGDGQSYLEELRGVLPGDYQARTGASLASKLAAASLYARIRQGFAWPAGTRFHTLGSFLNGQLGGGYACHLSNAAGTGLCHARQGRWLEDVIGEIGAGSLSFPEIRTGLASIGTARILGREVALYPDLGDHQACLLGSLARPETDVNVNIGTAGMAGRVTGRFDPSFESRPLLEGLFIRTITRLPGGRHVQALAQALAAAEGMDVSAVWERITVPPKEAYTGPVWDWSEELVPKITERISAGSHGDAAAALYAAMGEAYAQAIRRLGPGIERIVYSGNGALGNPALRAHIQSASRLPGVPEAHEGVMRGLLLCALLISGACESVAQARVLLENAGQDG